MGPRPKNLRLGKESKNKELEKKWIDEKKKKLHIFVIHGEICSHLIKIIISFHMLGKTF